MISRMLLFLAVLAALAPAQTANSWKAPRTPDGTTEVPASPSRPPATRHPDPEE